MFPGPGGQGRSQAVRALTPPSPCTISTTAASGYATWENWPPAIPPTILATGPAVAMAVGVLADLYLALLASRLAPTEALRSL